MGSLILQSLDMFIFCQEEFEETLISLLFHTTSAQAAH